VGRKPSRKLTWRTRRGVASSISCVRQGWQQECYQDVPWVLAQCEATISHPLAVTWEQRAPLTTASIQGRMVWSNKALGWLQKSLPGLCCSMCPQVSLFLISCSLAPFDYHRIFFCFLHLHCQWLMYSVSWEQHHTARCLWPIHVHALLSDGSVDNSGFCFMLSQAFPGFSVNID